MERKHLIAAMAEFERLLRKVAVEISIERADSADAGRCLEAYYAELAQCFDGGFEPAQGNTVIAAKMTPLTGWFVIARLDSEAVCGKFKALTALDQAGVSS
jgi:hypothetical protein